MAQWQLGFPQRRRNVTKEPRSILGTRVFDDDIGLIIPLPYLFV